MVPTHCKTTNDKRQNRTKSRQKVTFLLRRIFFVSLHPVILDLSHIFRTSFAHVYIYINIKNMSHNTPKLKSEFAAQLFPNVSEKTARRYLYAEINSNTQLKAQLSAIGFKPSTKILTVRMQQIIRTALIG